MCDVTSADIVNESVVASELESSVNLDLDKVETTDKMKKTLQEEFASLDNKFNKINASGKKRDIGVLAVKRAPAIERIVNRGSKQAVRCVEVAMGDPLTEKEKNATKKSQINPICPDLVNPSYVPY